MVQHVKCDKIADVDKFFEKSGMPLDQVKIVHVSTKMGGFYMVFYDDGLPYPEKKSRGKAAEKPATPGEVPERPQVKQVAENFDPTVLFKGEV